jgi:hypothetical protein
VRRYLDIALTGLAATILAPIALWVIAVVVGFAFVIGLREEILAHSREHYARPKQDVAQQLSNFFRQTYREKR